MQRDITQLAVVWPDEDACQAALNNFATLQLSHGLGLLDALIAATVVGRGAELATFNVRHYQHVPGLVTVQSYARP